ncbi:MAG: alpha/beta fold hydrolase [Myxococcota bacterium]|jgi:pimeloyl-ACP methyl ester carboxylesterase|nr:alpha/beta fold hydrolase [Myxococcota bacterium]
MRGLPILWILCASLSACAPLRQVRSVTLLEPADTLAITAADGGELVLHHYPPLGEPISGVPVLVCHGIASNHHTWALGPDRDFGAHLAAAGFDTYLVDLRGHGASPPAAASTSVDTYAIYDLPAAVDAVRDVTGAEQVAWIGHSMGGLVLVAHLARGNDPHLAAAVTVGSPVDWRGDDQLTRLIRALLRVLSGPLPARNLSAFYAQWEGHIPHHLDRVVYEPANMERWALADMMRVGVSPIQDGVRRQFAATIEAGSFVSADGTLDYMDAAPSITLPFLVVAGRADHLSPPERTLPFFEALGSQDKSWRVFGRDQGDAADYGHVDLCNGDHAAEDVYPYITTWLLERLAGSPDG